MASEKAKLILVEDDSFLREIIYKRLVQEGFFVTPVEDGEKAIEEMGKGNFDLMLLDIILPGINGFEILERIRNSDDEKEKNMPIIMLSNLGQDEDIDKAMDLGANNYLVKAHFTTDEIIDKIKKELGK